LDASIDRRGVTFIGGGDPLGPAPGEVAPGVAPLGEAASRGGGTRGGTPPETLMGLQHLYRISGAGPLVLYNLF
jgi:hypothetical protein